MEVTNSSGSRTAKWNGWSYPAVTKASRMGPGVTFSRRISWMIWLMTSLSRYFGSISSSSSVGGLTSTGSGWGVSGIFGTVWRVLPPGERKPNIFQFNTVPIWGTNFGVWKTQLIWDSEIENGSSRCAGTLDADDSDVYKYVGNLSD